MAPLTSFQRISGKFSFTPNPNSQVACARSEEYWKKKSQTIYERMFIFGLKVRENLSLLHAIFLNCSWGVERRIPPFPFRTFIIERRCAFGWSEGKVEEWRSWIMTASVLSQVYHVFYIPSKQERERKLYAEIVSTLYLFFCLHRHVYYIDFDIIAIILQTMMCSTFSISPVFFPPCVSIWCFEAKVFYHKNKIDSAFKINFFLAANFSFLMWCLTAVWWRQV